MPFAPSLQADLAACQDLMRGGSRTFSAASHVLPARISEPATALYAFCRVADDLIDCNGGASALNALRDRLDQVYAGTPSALPADRALAGVVAHFAIPRALLEALLDGFAWDASGRQYETLDELQDYAARVAGTVGAMMAVLMGARSPAQVARACDLGTAMQLTNIARDVGEDARAGRLYLPRSWLRGVGIDPEAWLAEPHFAPAIGAVVERLLQAAETLYARADSGIAALPWDCRPGIRSARLLYAQIGAEIARNGFDSVTRRAVVPVRRKLRLVGWAVLTAMLPGKAAPAPPLQACRYLVQAVTLAPSHVVVGGIGDRVVWVLELFARLQQQQIHGGGGL
ncbi:phytoene/squalene synthase family protein [Acidisphaera sp. L21]|jgi:phytoene synthase|uniref:phytoene/squalene synthase family protein n=1 Tax=Acidisphaera sp. L21 TaxID=1641851 RepID=UPI00131BAE89|nr:phytoene/squalene synthase family protein [Acidisphaera sp. L21]